MRAERRELEWLYRQVAEDTEDAVRAPVAKGYAVLDAATLVGVSYQRVSQLIQKAS